MFNFGPTKQEQSMNNNQTQENHTNFETDRHLNPKVKNLAG